MNTDVDWNVYADGYTMRLEHECRNAARELHLMHAGERAANLDVLVERITSALAAYRKRFPPEAGRPPEDA